jgi:hypothetical protein
MAIVMYSTIFGMQRIPTDSHINVVAIVQAGRARWKVENENNNTLKTQGYNLTHNFGTGANIFRPR